MRRVGRTAMCRPTPPRPASALLSAHRCAGSASPHDNDERALSRWYFVPCSRAADLFERSPIAPSGASCAVLDTPPSADRRHRAQLRCCSLPIAASAPRAHTTMTSERCAASALFLPQAPPGMPLARVRRFVRLRMRRFGRAAKRRPTSPHSAPLLLTAHRRAGAARRHDDGERAPRAANTSFLHRALPTSSNARRSRRRAPRAPCWPHCRAPTDVTTPSFVATHRPSPRWLREPTRRQRARAEPRARRSLIARHRPRRARAGRVVERRVRCVGRTAERRPTSPRPASLPFSTHRRAGSTILHDDDERARASAEPRARRSLLERRRSNSWRALVASSGAACAALAAPPTADRCHHAQLR